METDQVNNSTELPDFKVERNFLLICLFLILINFFLEGFYTYFISNHFNYLGFKFDFAVSKYLESKCLGILFFTYSYYLYRKSYFLYVIFVLLLLFFYIPFSILYSYGTMMRGPLYSILIFNSIYTFIAPIKIPLLIPKISLEKKYIFFISITSALVIPLVMNYGLKVNFKTLIFQDIYETREVFSQRLSSIQDYFYNWEVKMVIPIFLVLCLIHRNFLIGFLLFLILIYLYLISGNKSVYVSTFTILFFYFFGRDYLSKTKIFMYMLFLGLIFLTVIDLVVLKAVFFRGIFVMRVFFFPALLTQCYFDYFSNVHLFFSEHGIFNLFFESPLPNKAALIISKVYFNTNEMYANNGIISDGFMNLGYWGVLLFALIFAFLFSFFNSLQIDARYFGIFFTCIFLFLSIPFFTIFLTGGLWLLIIFSFCLIKQKE